MENSKKTFDGVIDRYEENHVIICDMNGKIFDFIYNNEPHRIPEGTAVVVSVSESGRIQIIEDHPRDIQLKKNIGNKFRELLNKNKK